MGTPARPDSYRFMYDRLWSQPALHKVPMNLDCWRSFSYINKVYIHTLTCLAVMILIKPHELGIILPLLRAPTKLIRACGAWCGRKLNLPAGDCAQRMSAAVFSSAARLERRASKVIVRGATKRMKTASKPLHKKPPGPSHPKANPTKDNSPSHATLDRAAAAVVLQRLWRHRNPAVLAAHHNIATLRRNLLPYTRRGKRLSNEDFLLLFSYAVYSSLQDTCFMYFDYRFVD